MGIPKSPPKRYTSSRQLIAGDDFNSLNDELNSFQTLTATGASQAAAASINAANVEIPAGNAAGSVVLPVSYPGAMVNILNNSANTQSVFPGGTDQIQSGATGYGAAGAAVTMLTGVSAIFYCIKVGFWQVSKNGGP